MRRHGPSIGGWWETETSCLGELPAARYPRPTEVMIGSSLRGESLEAAVARPGLPAGLPRRSLIERDGSIAWVEALAVRHKVEETRARSGARTGGIHAIARRPTDPERCRRPPGGGVDSSSGVPLSTSSSRLRDGPGAENVDQRLLPRRRSGSRREASKSRWRSARGPFRALLRSASRRRTAPLLERRARQRRRRTPIEPRAT